ncbi:hypothetical protein A2G06_05350 [Geobacter anodireducens]|nr:hypothetical protein A2G06_05350 [Geobacter anodireducens]
MINFSRSLLVNADMHYHLACLKLLRIITSTLNLFIISDGLITCSLVIVRVFLGFLNKFKLRFYFITCEYLSE